MLPCVGEMSGVYTNEMRESSVMCDVRCEMLVTQKK